MAVVNVELLLAELLPDGASSDTRTQTIRDIQRATANRAVAQVDCFCTNNPKILEPGDWKVHFTGVWDFGRSAFTEHHSIRIPEWERYYPH